MWLHVQGFPQSFLISRMGRPAQVLRVRSKIGIVVDLGSIMFSLVSKGRAQQGVHYLDSLIYTSAYHGFRAERLIATFLHPVTSSVSAAASEVECEEPGDESLSPPATPNCKKCKKTKHRDSGLEACGWTSFLGFTTYWVIKKAPSMYCALCRIKKMVWVSVPC